MGDVKTDLRSRMRTALRALDGAQRTEWSLAAARNLLASAAWRDARTVSVFLSMPHEIDTTAIVEAAWASGRRVLAPRVVEADSTLQLLAIRRWSDCLPGYRKILEPLSGEVVDPAEVELMLVPGLAFDPRGGRLGQGGGFYDRLLALPQIRATTCGVAFEIQVVDEVPVEPHDHRVDVLVTDARLRRCVAR